MASLSPKVQLNLTETAGAEAQAAPWIGPLLALGSLASKYSHNTADQQLVIVLSVPKRDYAATLIGCGWVLASKAPVLQEPLHALRMMTPGQSLRSVNDHHVIVGEFISLDESVQPPQAQFAGSKWVVDRIRAVAAIPSAESPSRSPRPEPGSIERMAQLELGWNARLVLPDADLAIVGTKAWIEEEFDTLLSRTNDSLPPSAIGSILMPMTSKAATWFTRVYSAAKLADTLPIPPDVKAVVLDGNGAIRYLNDIESKVVFCVLDRSVSDETAAELVIQLRNTRGQPLSLADELQWSPPTGVEVLGFTVSL